MGQQLWVAIRHARFLAQPSHAVPARRAGTFGIWMDRDDQWSGDIRRAAQKFLEASEARTAISIIDRVLTSELRTLRRGDRVVAMLFRFSTADPGH